MADRPLRIALLGYGRIARLAHVPALGRLESTRLVAVVDRDPDARTEAERALPGSFVTDDLDAALASADAAVITLPNTEHADAARRALAAGLHVYVEKPVATTLEDAQAIVDARAAAGTVAAVGLNYRYREDVGRAGAALASGSLGRLVSVDTRFATRARERPSWKRTRSAGGGALLDLGSHHLDLVEWLVGSRLTATGCTIASVVDEDDAAVAVLVSESEVPVSVSVSTSGTEEVDRIELTGTIATLSLERRFARRSRWRPRAEPSFARALGAFASACAGGVEPALAGLDAGVRNLGLVLELERLARAGAEPVR